MGPFLFLPINRPPERLGKYQRFHYLSINYVKRYAKFVKQRLISYYWLHLWVCSICFKL